MDCIYLQIIPDIWKLQDVRWINKVVNFEVKIDVIWVDSVIDVLKKKVKPTDGIVNFLKSVSGVSDNWKVLKNNTIFKDQVAIQATVQDN